jgi:hypothetical protein
MTGIARAARCPPRRISSGSTCRGARRSETSGCWRAATAGSDASCRRSGATARGSRVACRLGLAHRRPTVLHHRRIIKEVVERDFGAQTSPIPREEYLQELRQARIGISPFGYGEVCFRDFEVMLAGAALVKPDMAHLETWPPVYVDGETYVAHRWDATDLKEAIERLLAGDAWRRIAARAQQVYGRYLFEREGHEEFAARVANIVRESARDRVGGPARLPR